MIFVGMDIHYKSTTACFFDPGEPEGEQYRWKTCPTTATALTELLAPLEGQCQVAYEVGTQAQWVASILRPLAADVQVANPSRIPWLYRDGRKNDRMDAKKLVTLLFLGQLPKVHLPGANVSAWRALIQHRRSLVVRQTAVKNQLRAMVRAFGERCPHRRCWTGQGTAWLLSLTFDEARGLMRDLLVQELEQLKGRLHQVEQRLDAIAKSQPNVALLRTIPGVGPRTAEAIVAFADGVGRFRSRKQFACYFGMTPTQDASGGRDYHGRISKQGPSVVRWVVVEATHQVIRRSRAFGAFCHRIQHGKKDRRKRAVVATGRKLLTVAFAMLRDQVPYDETRVSPVAA